jgi:formamidopyrimidine-DNA glycosylase
MKLRLSAENGSEIAFTDSRRFARIWLHESANSCPRVGKLGFDAYTELPNDEWFNRALAKRKAPIKAVLLDQSFVCGIGNWIADEVLYHARIAPNRTAFALSELEVRSLVEAIQSVLQLAVSVDADYRRFPESWLFHHRWGGSRGADLIEGREIQRETVGGRTTAWVPAIQR